MTARKGTTTATATAWDAPRAPRRFLAHWHAPRALAALIMVGVLVLAGLTGTALAALGVLAPFPRVTTLAELPAPLPPAVYSRVAVDAGGAVWVAQSAPGLATKPADATVLTIVDPTVWLGDKVQARLCLGCAGVTDPNETPPALARIDDIAPNPRVAHGIYVAGWTTPTAGGTSVPVVLAVTWHAGMATCSAHQTCADERVILSASTAVAYVNTPAHPEIPLLQQLLNVGVAPVLALATAPHGDLFCFLSDRGRDSLNDPEFNVIGGFQTLLKFDYAAQAWGEIYVGPGGNRATQDLSPTSTVTGMVVDHAERYIYLADADHQAIYRIDLQNPTTSSASPYVAASALTRIAGEPLAPGAYGDVAQAVPGWAGDGGPATAARLNAPRGLALDAAGDLLVSDAGNDRLRLITPGGTIWTVAGRGVPVVDGDTGQPLAAGLRGILGIAANGQGDVYAIQGGTVDGAGRVRLRRLTWGWATPGAVVARATSGGQGYAVEAVAGLTASNSQAQGATVLTASGCAGATGCATSYIILAGGSLPDQAPLALPSMGDATGVTIPPNHALRAPGTGVIVVAGGTPAQIAFAPAYAGCCGGVSLPAPIALPAGTQPTGLALIMPTTQAQYAYLGAAYILIAVDGDTGPPQLLIYKASEALCGTGTGPHCAPFPGTPTLATTLSFTGQTATGAVAAALSDDGHHAFVLVAHPADNQVSAIDLTAWFAHATPPAVAARLGVAAPAALVLRHDGLAAYIGTGDGQLATLATAGWLSGPIPATPAVTSTALGSTGAPTAQLALAADDTRLYVAQTAPSGAATLATIAIGAFGQPAAPQVLTTFAAPAHLADLTLAAGDARLLAVTAPAGPTRPGTLRTWLTRDPANPTQWLTTPLLLGDVTTPPAPLAIVGDN